MFIYGPSNIICLTELQMYDPADGDYRFGIVVIHAYDITYIVVGEFFPYMEGGGGH